MSEGTLILTVEDRRLVLGIPIPSPQTLAGIGAKSGEVLAVGFTGAGTKKATVIFGTAYPDDNYSATMDAQAINDKTFTPYPEAKTASGFTIQYCPRDSKFTLESVGDCGRFNQRGPVVSAHAYVYSESC